MPNPVQIEQLFQELNHQFENTASIRYRYYLFRNFIKSLEGEYKRYESYINQIITNLPLFNIPFTWSGLDPSEIEEDIDLFDILSSELQSIRNNIHAKKIIKRLHEVCVIAYCCLNEFELADLHLKSLLDSKISSLSDFAGNNSETGLKFLLNFLSHEIQKNERDIKKLSSLKKEIKPLIVKNKGKVLVPVVEEYVDSNKLPTVQFSRIRRLSVELYSDTEYEDELSQNFNVYGIESPTYVHKKEVINAARDLLREKTKKLSNSFFKGLINYELKSALHEGNSANFAISALWYTALLKKTGLREKFLIKPTVAITGGIENDGNVVEIASESIFQKSKAAFFSWCDVLVVPQAQKEQFEKVIEEFQKQYPARILDVVGVKHIRELFYDRRVTELVKSSAIVYYFQKTLDKSSSPINLLLLIVLLVVILALMSGPVNKNPVSFSFEGNYLVLANSNGVEISRIEVDGETARYQSSEHDIEVNPLAVLTDITNDGINELIWARRGNRADDRSSKVTAWSVRGDSLIWEKELKLTYEFPKQSALLETGLRSNQIRLIETENRGKLVINASSTMYFQSVVFLIDIQNGEIISEYIHIGQLRAMTLADLTGDGIDEIILTGINNAFWKAAIIVLDANDAHGYSPLTDDYRPKGLQPANELVYILVPKTPIGEYLGSIEKYNQGRYLHYDSISESIWARITEGQRFFRDFTEDAFTIIYFNRSMRPIGVGTSDLYDIAARELYEEGAIPFIPGYDYFEAYQDSLLYWNGEEFVRAKKLFSNKESAIN